MTDEQWFRDLMDPYVRRILVSLRAFELRQNTRWVMWAYRASR